MTENITQISPKSLKKISRRKFNMSYEWFLVVFVFLVASAVIVLLAIFSSGYGRIIFAAILCMLWGFFYKSLRNDELLENAKLTYQFYKRSKRGDTLISKYNESSTRLILRFLGILDIFTGGLLKYEGDIYFFLIQYTPKRLSDDSKIEHNQGIVTLLKSLKNGVQFQFNMNTSIKSNSKYENQILLAANGSNVIQPVKDHLFSIQKLINQSTKNNHPEFYIMCSMGPQNSLDEAQKTMAVMVGGLDYQFKSLDTFYRVISSREEIALTLYKKMTQGL
jgi:hypothetical protein